MVEVVLSRRMLLWTKIAKLIINGLNYLQMSGTISSIGRLQIEMTLLLEMEHSIVAEVVLPLLINEALFCDTKAVLRKSSHTRLRRYFRLISTALVNLDKWVHIHYGKTISFYKFLAFVRILVRCIETSISCGVVRFINGHRRDVVHMLSTVSRCYIVYEYTSYRTDISSLLCGKEQGRIKWKIVHNIPAKFPK